jgi:predicted CxxxxCH...CXXCH cytochrome family protein
VAPRALPLVVSFSLVVAAACTVDRETPRPPTWDDVAPIVSSECAACHSGSDPAAGWRVDSYLDAIACVGPNVPATLPASDAAPILTALDTPPHVGLLDAADLATLTAWVIAGAPAYAASVHAPSIIDPRAPGFHGETLRGAHWSPMLDPGDPNACGRCHDGTLSRPARVTMPAPGAPSCTSCHDQPGGVLACGTCHGTRDHAYPPRDPCFFPNDPSGGAHAAHGEPSSASASALPCATCHPAPEGTGADVMSGAHGDGAVEIAFAPTVAPEASWDPTSETCAVSCHDRGGLRPRPAWSETTPMGCDDCHRSPPAHHFAGACTACHAEANATGTSLDGGPLHMNGKVDLGDGSGLCGACHGSGDDPWPRDPTHQAHENPSLSVPIACSSCHVVPSNVFSPGHLDAPLNVTFSGLALARGAQPTWDGVSCRNVACHGARLADPPAAPAWNDTSGKAAQCGACHGIPPSQHTTALDCGRSGCHAGEVTPPPNLAITPAGRARHVDGVIDVE